MSPKSSFSEYQEREIDPHIPNEKGNIPTMGIDTKQHAALDVGAKQSTNPKDRIGITKVPLHLMPLIAISHCVLALLDGACKYGLWNWRREKVAATVYVAACKRHIDKWVEGRDKDPSGVHELGHAMACLAIILDAESTNTLVDDRPPATLAPEQIDAMAEDVKTILRNHGKLDPITSPINDQAAITKVIREGR